MKNRFFIPTICAFSTTGTGEMLSNNNTNAKLKKGMVIIIMESNAMKEIRKIRDENTERHLGMSKEEQTAELEKAVSWLLAATKKPEDDNRAS